MTIEEKSKAFERLLHIMDELRDKCPWDKKQTLETLRPLTIEEVYELSDAILKKDNKGIKEEIGDLFLHLVFYAKIGEEQGAFDVASTLDGLCDKLIARHPHIYGNTKADSEEEVKQNWEKLKLKEGRKSVLGGVPDSLPALIKAYRIQDKAAQVKFEWERVEDVWSKVEEELSELKAEILGGKAEKIEDELGDVFFALINYARFLKVDPEAALSRANLKFIRRFTYVEQKAAAAGKSLQEMTLAEMDAIWDEAKTEGL